MSAYKIACLRVLPAEASVLTRVCQQVARCISRLDGRGSCSCRPFLVSNVGSLLGPWGGLRGCQPQVCLGGSCEGLGLRGRLCETAAAQRKDSSRGSSNVHIKQDQMVGSCKVQKHREEVGLVCLAHTALLHAHWLPRPQLAQALLGPRPHSCLMCLMCLAQHFGLLLHAQ
jgi:hypothetical protein